MPTYIRVKDLANAATTPATDDFILLSGTANGARKISRADFLTAVAGFYTADPSTYKLATLDSGNKVLVSQLPSSAFSYKGTWAASTNTPTLANGTGTGGDTYYASDSGSVNFGAGSISFLAGDAVVYDGSVWQKVPDVVNLLDGKGTLDEAKTTLEIPDVGTSPQEVPLNGMLGSMAYQSADSVSVAELEVESTTGTATTQALTVTDGTDDNFVVQEGGNVGVGLSSPSGSGWDESSTVLHVKKDDTSGGLLALESSNTKAILNAGNNQLAVFTTTADPIRLGTSGSEAVRIDSSQRVGIGGSPTRKLELQKTGFLGSSTLGSPTDSTVSIDVRGNASTDIVQGEVLGAYTLDAYDSSGATGGGVTQNSGMHFVAGNHFGASASSVDLVFATGANGSTAERWRINSSGNFVSSGGGIDFTSGGASSLLDDYERGTTTPTDASGAGLTLAGVGCNYVKIGSQVTAWVKVTYPTTSDNSTATIGNLPFAFGSSDIDRIGGFVVYQNTGLDVSVLGTNGTGQVTFRNNSGTSYTNAQLSAKVIWFCVTYDVS